MKNPRFTNAWNGCIMPLFTNSRILWKRIADEGNIMTEHEALEKLLRAYGDYYNIGRDKPPFAAEAVFHSHEEQYFLIRAARIAEAESHEYIFFALESGLTAARLRELDAAAWNAGTARVVPHKDHRSSDIALIVLARQITPEAAALIPKLRHYRSYLFGFQGWTHYQLCAADLSAKRLLCNWQGRKARELIKANLKL